MLDDHLHQPSESLSDRLIELYVERDESCKHGDWRRARELQHEITETNQQRLKLLARAD